MVIRSNETAKEKLESCGLDVRQLREQTISSTNLATLENKQQEWVITSNIFHCDILFINILQFVFRWMDYCCLIAIRDHYQLATDEII